MTDDQFPADRLASRLLGAPLTAALAAIVLLEYLTWAPSYLIWPWWADHDVFATAAYSWGRGVKPYRDLLGNNFPGTTYLFAALGALFGRGNTVAFQAADAAMVAGFGVALVAWSRRRLGGSLGGLVAYAAFLNMYMNLDYTHVGQRDWHASGLAATAILAAEAWPGRLGRLAGALGIGLALTIRPQAVFFAPALAMAVAGGPRPVRALVEWAGATTAVVVAGFAPLWLSGIGGDFLRSLARASVGGSYNRLGVSTFARTMLEQLGEVRNLAIPAAALLLRHHGGPAARRTTVIWLAAVGGAMLYRPLSPNPSHTYLTQPLAVAVSAMAGVLAGLLAGASTLKPTTRLAALLVLCALCLVARPRFCNPVGSANAVLALARGDLSATVPTGYVPHPGIEASARYDWGDYQRLLKYLRTEVSPATRVANHLYYLPAVTGPADRTPAFPAESTAWLRVVRAQDEALYAEALEHAEGSIVVWDPDPPPLVTKPRFARIDEVVKRLYTFDRRFGPIEVWTRRANPGP